MHKPLLLDHTVAGTVQLITLAGVMDAAGIAALADKLDQLVIQKKVRVVLDLSALEYLSSAGLGTVIGRTREFRRQNGDIRVGGCSARVDAVLMLCGFTQAYRVYESCEQAVKSYEGRS
ncbi:STAS domain-containing protein [candidate division FCPU426 bacterium]|nr:STAS domain-containing protein [candidate division FCPU426 bacterium]